MSGAVGSIEVDMTADVSGAADGIVSSMDDALRRVAQIADSAFSDVTGAAEDSSDAMSDAARAGARAIADALDNIDTSGLEESTSEVARLKAAMEDARRAEANAAKEANAAEQALVATLQGGTATVDQVVTATQRAVQARRDADAASSRAVASTEELTRAQEQLNDAQDEGADGASSWGEKMDGAFSKVAAGAAGLAGVAVGIDSLTEAFDRMDLSSTLTAQLDLTQEEAAKAGQITGALYEQGFGESFEQITESIGAVASTLGNLTDDAPEQIEQVTKAALTLSEAFGTEVAESTQSVNNLIRRGLVKDAAEGFDLLYAGMSRVPAAMRDEVMPVLDEYAVSFAAAGMSGEQAMGLVVNAAQDGSIAMDKVGDSVKEFIIKATDINDTGAVEAMEEMGLSAEDMSNKLLTGGEGAFEAFNSIVGGLQKVKDPAEQAALSVAIFGTPLEDLSKNTIPGFLTGLGSGASAMGDFRGSVDRAGESLRSGPNESLKRFQRGVQDAIVNTLGTATGYLLEHKGILYGLAGALGAAVVAYGAIRTAALVSSVATGISTAVTGGNTAALATNKIAMGAAAIASGVMKAGQLAGAAATGVATAAQWAFNSALLASPITWIVVAIMAVVAVIVLIATKTDWFQKLWTTCWNWIKDAASTVWESALKPVFDKLMEIVGWVGDKIMWLWESIIQPVFGFIAEAAAFLWGGIELAFRLIGAVFEVIGIAWQKAWDTLIKPVVDSVIAGFNWLWENGIRPVIDFIVAGFQLLWAGVQVVLGWIRDGVAAAWSGLQWVWDSIIKPVLDWIGAGFLWLWDHGIKPVVDWIKDKLADMGRGFSRLWDGVKDVVAKIGEQLAKLGEFFGRVKDKIVGIFAGAGRWLWDMGKNIVQGLLDGAGSLLSKIGDFFLNLVPGWIKGPFKKALGIASPSKVFAGFGVNLGEGLVAGMASMSGKTADAAAALAGSAADAVGPVISAAAPSVEVPSVAAPAVAVDAPAVDPAAGGAGVGDALAASAAMLGEVKAGQIDPIMAGLTQGVTDFATAAQTQLSTVVDPAWLLSATNLATVQTTMVAPTLAAMNLAVQGTAGLTQTSVFGAINPAWMAMGSNVSAVFTGTVNPVMDAMRGAVANTANAFGQGAANIATQWNQVREATASPVRFAIGAVFNDGIVGMWNSVSDLLGTQRMNTYPIRFASGGTVPGSGGPTADDVPAMLSSREFVAPVKMIEAVGGGSWSRGAGILEGMRKRVLGGGVNIPKGPEGLFGKFAAGGVVQGTPAWESLKRGHAFAAQHSGKPYVWGGSLGPDGGTDCSGYMSSIADRILGGSGLYRKWATGAFPGGGNSQGQAVNAGGQTWLSGLSAGMSIGVSDVHTAGTLGGVAGLPTVNIESGGSHGRVAYGGPAVGADHGQFPTRYHLPIAAGSFVSGGGGGGNSMSMGDIVGSITGPAWEKIATSLAGFKGAGGMIDSYPPKLAEKMKDITSKKIDKLIQEMTTFADPGGGGVERWRPMVKLLLLRYGLGEENTDRTLRRMNQESGGNPRAINLWDSNAKAGIPSKGLMQVIDPTFASFRDPALSPDIWDPMANTGASMRYAMGQYGSLSAAYDRPGGYDMGGIARGKGFLMKDIIDPERVLDATTTRSFDRLVGNLEAVGSGGDVRIGGLRIGSDGSMRLESAHTPGGLPQMTAGRDRTTVLVNQYITGGTARETADAVSDRLTALVL